MSNEKVLLRLKTARGQIDAVIKMIEDERYCIDISNQLLAIQSLIKMLIMRYYLIISTIVLKMRLMSMMQIRK